jgi:transposase
MGPAKLKEPNNITSIFLPSRAPELNPVENIWQYLRASWLSNRVFGGYGYGHGGIGLIGVLVIILLILVLTGRL